MKVRRIVDVMHTVGEPRATYILECGHTVDRRYSSTKIIANCYECDWEMDDTEREARRAARREADLVLVLEQFGEL